jgi:formate dehydrogenase maturation protein FdhE
MFFSLTQLNKSLKAAFIFYLLEDGKMKNKIKKLIAFFKSTMKEIATETVEEIKEIIKENVREIIKTVFNNVIKILTLLIEDIKEFIGDVLSGLF